MWFKRIQVTRPIIPYQSFLQRVKCSQLLSIAAEPCNKQCLSIIMCVHFYVCKRSLELFSTVRICFGESKSIIIINVKVKKTASWKKFSAISGPTVGQLLADSWPTVLYTPVSWQVASSQPTVCRLSVGKLLVTDSSLIFLPYILPKQYWMYIYNYTLCWIGTCVPWSSCQI